MTKPKQTTRAKPKSMLVTLLLDRTGSMESCKQATIEAFNAYVRSLRKDADKVKVEFTFLQFDSMSLDKVCVAEPIAKVKLLDDKSYQPRAATPLVDACVKTIKAVEKSLEARKDKPKIVVAFQTDGYENASNQYRWEDLNAMIKDKTAEGWQFLFMGAGIDAYATGSRMGMHVNSTVSYDKDDCRKTVAAFAATGANTMAFGQSLRADASYTMAQKQDAGDAYINKVVKPVEPKNAVDDVDLTGNA